MNTFSVGAIALSASLLAGSIAQAATVTIYTDRTAFEAALTGGTKTETFSGQVDPFFTITGSNVSVSNGKLNDQINDGPNVSTTFSFGNGIHGFGGDWDLAGPGGQGTGIAATLNLVGGGFVDLARQLPSTLANSFFGVISSMAFDSVDLREGSGCCVETYSMDNLTVGDVAPVPLPASLPLLLAAFGGVALMRRLKDKS